MSFDAFRAEVQKRRLRSSLRGEGRPIYKVRRRSTAPRTDALDFMCEQVGAVVVTSYTATDPPRWTVRVTIQRNGYEAFAEQRIDLCDVPRFRKLEELTRRPTKPLEDVTIGRLGEKK